MGKYNNLKDLLSTLWKNERKIYCCKYAKNTKLKKPKISCTWNKHIYIWLYQYLVFVISVVKRTIKHLEKKNIVKYHRFFIHLIT